MYSPSCCLTWNTKSWARKSLRCMLSTAEVPVEGHIGIPPTRSQTARRTRELSTTTEHHSDDVKITEFNEQRLANVGFLFRVWFCSGGKNAECYVVVVRARPLCEHRNVRIFRAEAIKGIELTVNQITFISFRVDWYSMERSSQVHYPRIIQF